MPRAIRPMLLLPVILVVEIALLVVGVATWPFFALDNRHGWTPRGRRWRAMETLRLAPAVSIESATGAARAVIEGRLAPMGPLVQVPTIGCDVLAWCVWACDGGHIRFVDGALTPVALVDGAGRARIATIGARDVPYDLGERAPLREVLPAWGAAAGAGVEEWTISWVPLGTRVRASGRLSRATVAGYREPAPTHTLQPSDDGVPVLLSSTRE